MLSPEVQHIFRSRLIDCPVDKPRLLHQVSPSTSIISSIDLDENHSYTMTPEESVSPVNSILQNQAFRCHDCPQPQLLGCKTSGDNYESASLSPTPIAEYSLAKSFPPGLVITEPKQDVKTPDSNIPPKHIEGRQPAAVTVSRQETPTPISFTEMISQLKQDQIELNADNSSLEPFQPEWLQELDFSLI